MPARRNTCLPRNQGLGQPVAEADAREREPDERGISSRRLTPFAALDIGLLVVVGVSVVWYANSRPDPTASIHGASTDAASTDAPSIAPVRISAAGPRFATLDQIVGGHPGKHTHVDEEVEGIDELTLDCLLVEVTG